MRAFVDERELLAILALAGAALWLPRMRVNLSALRAAIVWDLAEAGRIQAESDAFQFGATLNIQGVAQRCGPGWPALGGYVEAK